MIFGCTGNYRKTEYFEILSIIEESITSLGHECLLSSDCNVQVNPPIPKNMKMLDFSDVVEKSDIILSIGGDGTILSTARRIGTYKIPILGIHIGGLGFLSETTKDTITKSIEHVINDNYQIDMRMVMQLALSNHNGKDEMYYALNDIVVDHGTSGRILKSEIMVSGQYLNTYESDGIIISTSTGSTAYSLSAGGPIIYPSISTLTVTPICPHSLSARAIVLPGDEELKIEFSDKYEGIACTIDGQIRIQIKDTASLEIKKADHQIQMISLPFNNYFNTLRTKMGWSGNLR